MTTTHSTIHSALNPTAAPGRRHAVFHPLRVASVDRLTEDSVAITFHVPEELRDEFRFKPGQHLSVRAPASVMTSAGTTRSALRRPAGRCESE